MSQDDDRIPVFVERQTYRRRRLLDAARALPVLGVLLWMVPLLWGLPEDKVSAANALIYLFLVWAGMILLSGLLVRALERSDKAVQKEGEPK